MTVAEVETIKARARRLYEAGVCPGCDAPLIKVAGVGVRHWKSGQWLSDRAARTPPGALASGADPDDPRLCGWSADELTVLVHLGSGLVGSGDATAARPPRAAIGTPGERVEPVRSGPQPTRTRASHTAAPAA